MVAVAQVSLCTQATQLETLNQSLEHKLVGGQKLSLWDADNRNKIAIKWGVLSRQVPWHENTQKSTKESFGCQSCELQQCILTWNQMLSDASTHWRPSWWDRTELTPPGAAERHPVISAPQSFLPWQSTIGLHLCYFFVGCGLVGNSNIWQPWAQHEHCFDATAPAEAQLLSGKAAEWVPHGRVQLGASRNPATGKWMRGYCDVTTPGL